MAWRHSGDKPLSETMMVILPTHICLTRPQWVNPSGARTTGITLAMCPANERHRYNVTMSLIGWTHTSPDPWDQIIPRKLTCILTHGGCVIPYGIITTEHFLRVTIRPPNQQVPSPGLNQSSAGFQCKMMGFDGNMNAWKCWLTLATLGKQALHSCWQSWQWAGDQLPAFAHHAVWGPKELNFEKKRKKFI